MLFFATRHSYPDDTLCDFLFPCVKPFKYKCFWLFAGSNTSYYGGMHIDSHTLAILAEERIFIVTFCFRYILHLIFILPEIFFRQISFVGIEAVVPYNAEIVQRHVLKQSGEELTIVQR